MATSRAQAPPVNLKERIAALQQRNVSPGQSQNSQMANKSLPPVGGLRDKIAKFEQKGGVPVPRGSFGMGAPQLAENAPAKKRGELYGNRIQGLGRPSVSRSGSPMPPSDSESSPSPRKRCVSSGAALSDGPLRAAGDEPVPPLPSTLSFASPRRNSLAVDFGAGRRVVSSSGALGRDLDESESLSSSPTADRDAACDLAESSAESLGHIDGSSAILADDQESPATNSSVLETATAPSQDEPATSITFPSTESPPDNEAVTRTPVSSAQPLESLVSEVAEIKDEESSSVIPNAVSVEASEALSTAESAVTRQSPVLEDEQTEPATSDMPSPSLSAPSSVTPSDFDNGAGFDTPLTPLTPVDEGATTHVAERPSASLSHPVISVVVSPSDERRPVYTTTQTSKNVQPTAADNVEPEVRQGNVTKRSFTAVVHRKVTETPAATIPASSLVPVTPQISRIRRSAKGTVIEPPPSPGYGELAALLEEAALLEMRLTEGNGSTEFRNGSLKGGDGSAELRSWGLSSEEPSPIDPQPPKTPTNASFRPELRNDSASTLTSQTRTQSIDSRSLSDRSISIPSIREPTIDGDIPEEDEGGMGTTHSPKSPLPKYLSGFRRLASSSSSRRSSSYMPGAYPRDSISVSSEDSAPVRTPSDSGSDAAGGPGNGVAWPSVSPKKSGMGRSSSFADKLFHRGRTKSNVSTAETDRGSIHESPSRSYTLSTSSNSSLSKRPQARSPTETPGVRPNSWVHPRDSLSSISPPGSLFDKDIFDAFPSVPQTVPPAPPHSHSHSHLSPDDYPGGAVGRASTLPVKGRKQVAQRLSMV
ncbi:hypothetical protein BV22DRAFT_114427 [Leucogyrophana mollusca]|uniref:Uncharacterized protein n=1 Tax=Leucogyrophana mollusca TaxID=85980 RepID=A0ACB8BYA2_9AGAM|nr:hypothetical protein BV22DRAFT_114427 [Leucogyrophana mollusca]